MSLCSLKNSTQLAERRDTVTVDEFIDEAMVYAAGQTVVHQLFSLDNNQNGANNIEQTQPMKRATFTLTDSAIKQLANLSAQTGISKSRLIRIWAENFASEQDVVRLLASCSQ